ncbi:MAG: three-Cys-motif partner protein TcmP [Bacteroidales bacterium]|nr:three-Cys-motif partner protein TcmP [Bacteroidales bacterium]
MKKRKAIDAKKNILPHSQAKLDFYKDYLKRYIPILRLANFTTSINIFDVFCGTGIYENGKKGSPIIAFDAIKESNKNIFKLNKPLTPINLFINDLESGKIEQIKQYLENQSEKICKFEFHNKDAIVFLTDIEKIINNQTSKDRNLILIDPYGYKNIRKEYIEKLIKNKRNTELILFLPISQIYRFASNVLNNKEQNNVKALQAFIESFFPDRNHPIYKNQLPNEKSLIEHIRQALTFNDRYFATSYYIQRDNKNHYYALFFITPNIYGLEKILEVKWSLNEEHGEGFEQPKQMQSLFANIEKENSKQEQYKKLEQLLLKFISANKKVNNNQIYELTLKNMFLKKHSNEVLRNLQKDDKIRIIDIQTKKKARKGAFYLGYDYFKKQEIKILISIN